MEYVQSHPTPSPIQGVLGVALQQDCFKEYSVHIHETLSCFSSLAAEGVTAWHRSLQSDYLLPARASGAEQFPLYSGSSLAGKVAIHHWCQWCFNSKLCIISNGIIAKGLLGWKEVKYEAVITVDCDSMRLDHCVKTQVIKSNLE